MKTKKILIVLLILSLLAMGGGYVAYRGYKSIRQVRLIKQARAYLAKPDDRRAYLCLQRALRYNPKDVAACRLMAELAERTHSPAALVLRSRVVELDPHSLDDRLSLVQCATMFRNYAAATNALEGVDVAGKKTAAYHMAAGTLDATANLPAQAEAHFLEVIRLEPTNQIAQLNLAVVRLHGTNATAASEARAALTRIASDPVVNCVALRELTLDAMASRQTNNALALSLELVQQTNSTFNDQLLRLEVLRGSRNAAFEPALAACEREAGTNTAKIYELGTWQRTRMGPKDSLAWLQSLSGTVQTNQTLALLAADCRVQLRDWRGLNGALTNQNWGELEFVRHAFLANGLRGQELSGASKAEWELALKIAAKEKTKQEMLLELAVQWKWQSEAEELLWTIVKQYPGEHRLVEVLAQTLYAEGRTRPLMMLYSQELKRSPTDLAIKNNLAMIALLLDAKELKPHELAHDVYEQAPTNSSYVSTYAYSLYEQGKNAEALSVIERLQPRELEDPSIAGYYGLILKANGNAAKARACLETAAKAKLLPEELKLFTAAKGGA
jgi:predicted Zn-dependent protease